MKITYLDTASLENVGKEIVNLANEFNLEITNFYKLLTEIPYNGDAWTGSKAEEYSKIVSLDKGDYINFGSYIKQFGESIISIANDGEGCIRASEAGNVWKC